MCTSKITVVQAVSVVFRGMVKMALLGVPYFISSLSSSVGVCLKRGCGFSLVWCGYIALSQVTRVAHTALADYCILRGTLVRAMQRWRDHCVLLVGNLRTSSLPHLIVCCEVRPHRHVVPRHKPESGHVDFHVVVPQAALVPGAVVRCAFDHRSAGVDRHLVGKDSVRPIHGLDDLILGKMPHCL